MTLESTTACSKGLATSHLDYARPERRQTVDVDVLVVARDHDSVLARLAREGYRQIIGGDPGHYSLYKSNYLVDPDGIEIDLHHRLFRHGRQLPQLAWRQVERFEIAGKQFAALSAPWRLVHACAHAMFSSGSTAPLSIYLDPVRIAQVRPEVIGEALEIASELGLACTIATAMHESAALIGAHHDFDANVALHVASPHDAVALWAFHHPERTVAREQVSLTLSLGPIQAIKWAWAWIRPSPGYAGPTFPRRVHPGCACG